MFGKPDDRDAQISTLRSEAEDTAEMLSNEQQLRSEAVARVATMIKSRDPAQMDQIALDAATAIDDEFARGFEGAHIDGGWIGPAQMRRNSVARIIRGLIDNALLGAPADKI